MCAEQLMGLRGPLLVGMWTGENLTWACRWQHNNVTIVMHWSIRIIMFNSQWVCEGPFLVGGMVDTQIPCMGLPLAP
jgi:hypothetical protein